MATQLMKMLAASTEEGVDQPTNEEQEPELDPESKDFMRNAAEINRITDKETISLDILAQATG